MLGMTVGDMNVEMGSLISMAMMGSQSNRGHLTTQNHQRKSGCNYCNEQQ